MAQLQTHKSRADSTNLSVAPILIPPLLPANPFGAGQLERCILATRDIVEVKRIPV